MSHDVTYNGSQVIINMNSDIGDSIVTAALKSSVDLIVESIVHDVREMHHQQEIAMFRVENIRQNVRYLEAAITNLEHYGHPLDPCAVLYRILQESGVFDAE